MVASGAVLLSTPAQNLPSRVLRQVLGAFFRPAGAALAAGQGALYGPTGKRGDVTLLTDATLRVDPALFVINGTHNAKQGQYIVPNDELVDLAVPAKDAASSRRVYIAVRVSDSAEAGVVAGPTTDVPGVIELQSGALAAANPVLPVPTANTLYLGELSVPSVASGLPVTITKYAPYAVLRGQVYPVPDRAARLAIPAADRYPGLDVLELDKGRSWRWDGIGWDLIAGQKPHFMGYPSASAQPIGAGWNEIYFVNELADTDNALTPITNNIPASSRFYAPETGYWRTNGQIAYAAVAAGQVLRAAQLSTNGRDRIASSVAPFNATGPAAAVLGSTNVVGYTAGSTAVCVPVNPRRVFLQAGEWVSLWGYSNVGTALAAFALTDVGQQSFLEVEWDGAR